MYVYVYIYIHVYISSCEGAGSWLPAYAVPCSAIDPGRGGGEPFPSLRAEGTPSHHLLKNPPQNTGNTGIGFFCWGGRGGGGGGGGRGVLKQIVVKEASNHQRDRKYLFGA